MKEITFIPNEILTLPDLADLPPSTLLEGLTPDQADWWHFMNFCWQERMEALDRFRLGLPVALPDWSKIKSEAMMADVSRYLALYKLISFGWQEICEAGRDLPDLPSGPGEMFGLLLRNQAIAGFVVCLDRDAFSPQGRYRSRQKLIKGDDTASTATQKQAKFLALENAMCGTLSRSPNRQVQLALREYMQANGETMRLQSKAAHPNKKRLLGGKWAEDGEFQPSQRGVRHHLNQEDLE